MYSDVSPKELIESGHGVRLIKFGASWCKPCRNVAPEIEQHRHRLHPDVRFVSVDLDEDMELYNLLKQNKVITCIPSIILYADGNTQILEPDSVAIGSGLIDISTIFARANLFAR